MSHALQWLRSLVFVGQIYLAMAIIGLVYLPWALVSRKGAYAACKAYCRWVLWSARWMVGIRSEVRGQVPVGEVLIAAKHQSFLDIMMIFLAVPAGKFIMKREILWTPIIGLYAWRIGCVPVNRGQRGKAIRQMMQDVAQGARDPGQLIIYSQGTRIAPGVKAPYKAGTAALYEQLNQYCVPTATNVGVLWPRKGIMRRPGLAVVEFLEPIPPGLEKAQLMGRLEQVVEERSDALMREAGFRTDEISRHD